MGSNPTPGTFSELWARWRSYAYLLRRGRSLCAVTPWDEEDDWVGEPPEGRHARERADPTFWSRRPLLSFAWSAILSVALFVLLFVLLG